MNWLNTTPNCNSDRNFRGTVDEILSDTRTQEDFTPAIDMCHGEVSPHQHHFHARSCQTFDQKFSVFLVQTNIVRELQTLQKQIIPHLKALISGFLDFEG